MILWSVHMLSRKDQKSSELDTIRVSRNPATTITANGEVHTSEESNSERPRPCDGTDLRGHACSPVAGKTLRRTQPQNCNGIQCNTENYAQFFELGDNYLTGFIPWWTILE